MKRYSNFVPHRKTIRDLDSGKAFARRRGLSRTLDVIVAATLLAFLVVAIVSRAAISDDFADSSVDRQGFVTHVIDVVATFGLSIGLTWLLFSRRPRADDEGARS